MLRSQRQRQQIKAAFSPTENVQEVEVKEGEREITDSLRTYCPQAISPLGKAGKAGRVQRGRQLGQGARQNPPNVQPRLRTHMNLQTPSRHSTQFPFYSILSGTF